MTNDIESERWPSGVMGPVAVPLYGDAVDDGAGGSYRPVEGDRPGFHMVATLEAANRLGLSQYKVDPPDGWPSWSGVESVGLTFADEAEARAAMGDPDLAALKAEKNRAVTALREAHFADGYSPADGPLAGHTLQVRNIEDRTNWQTSAISYQSAVAAGHGAVPGATFRTADNQTVVLTFMEGLLVIVQGMAQWGQAIMGRSWDLKDEIDAAPDREALEAIDITAGWP